MCVCVCVCVCVCACVCVCVCACACEEADSHSGSRDHVSQGDEGLTLLPRYKPDVTRYEVPPQLWHRGHSVEGKL